MLFHRLGQTNLRSTVSVCFFFSSIFFLFQKFVDRSNEIDVEQFASMLFKVNIFYLGILISVGLVSTDVDECQFLTMCKCTNFPLFALIDTSYLSKPRSISNQDLFCTYSSQLTNETKLTSFDQFKYFYYRFRTLTFSNYPLVPSKAFRFVHFESQSVKNTPKSNNRNVIAFVQVEQTQSGSFPSNVFFLHEIEYTFVEKAFSKN